MGESTTNSNRAARAWVMYFDGSLKLEGAGAGVLLISPKGEQLKYVLQIFWKVSNNKAEYEDLLHGLRLAISLGIKRLLVYDNSAVVINQVNKSWDHNKENMDANCLEVRKLENKFYSLEFHHVVRDNNVAADVLSKLGSTRASSILESAPTTTDPTPSQASKEVMMIDVDWRQPFIDYIREQKVLTDKNLAEQIIRQAKSYVLVGDKLYKRGRHFWSTHEVRSPGRRQGHLGGDPQRHLRQPRAFSHAGQQGFPTSFLLAHSFGRC
jgi:ribonuclease HI